MHACSCSSAGVWPAHTHKLEPRGSCACRLADAEGVGAILNLQEDSDMAYFDLDVAPIRARCAERGDVAHARFPIRDFDPFDLRMKLPGSACLTDATWPACRCCMCSTHIVQGHQAERAVLH